MGVRRGLSKNGIFFMTITIVVISLFVLSATVFSGYALRKSVQKRVESLSEFVNGAESDLSRQLYIFGYRSVFVMQKEIVENCVALNCNYLNSNVSLLVQEAFLNGSLKGEDQPILQKVTFSEMQSELQKRADKISARVDLSNPVLSVSQEDPWNVKFVLVTDFFVEDKSQLASWNKTLTTTVLISIENFSDPVYAVGTNGERDHKIMRTPYSTFDVAAINDHLDKGYYRNYSGAPSFIDRLEGNIVVPRDPANGIESLVSVPDVPPEYLKGQKSCVDYIYFSSLNPSSCQVAGTPSWFRLENPHTTAYGVAVC